MLCSVRKIETICLTETSILTYQNTRSFNTRNGKPVCVSDWSVSRRNINVMWRRIDWYIWTNVLEVKVKGFPVTGHAGKGRSRGIAPFILNLGARWGGWSASRPGRFTRWKDPVPIVQEAGWAPRAGLGECGGEGGLLLSRGFELRTFQRRYTDDALPAPTLQNNLLTKYTTSYTEGL